MKRECEKCNKVYRKVFKNKNGIYMCGYCRKLWGTNPFYLPPKIRGEKENKKWMDMNLKEEEIKALWKQYKLRGLSDQEASRRVKHRQRYLKWFSRTRMKRKIQETKSEMNKKLLEDLKNK